MSSRADHLDRIVRRVAFLEKRVLDLKAQGKNYSFDEAEAATLKWVLEQLQKPPD